MEMSKNPRDGKWYWITISKPTLYFFVKGLGGEAEEQADAALDDLGPIAIVIFTLFSIFGVIWLVGRMFGAW
jgi:hypothetical protein